MERNIGVSADNRGGVINSNSGIGDNNSVSAIGSNIGVVTNDRVGTMDNNTGGSWWKKNWHSEERLIETPVQLTAKLEMR